MQTSSVILRRTHAVSRVTQGLLHSSCAGKAPGEKRPPISPQTSCFQDGLSGGGDTVMSRISHSPCPGETFGLDRNSSESVPVPCEAAWGRQGGLPRGGDPAALKDK